MKEIAEIEQLIEDCKKEFDQITTDQPVAYDRHRKLRAKLNKRIGFLRSAKQYLEFSPTEDFIKKQKKGCNAKIKAVNEQLLKSKITCKKTIAKIKKEEGVMLAKQQLVMLNFIL